MPTPTRGARVEPIDLGTLSLERLALLRPGDLAPAFEVATVDGKVLKLDDFRGKVVATDLRGAEIKQAVADALAR